MDAVSSVPVPHNETAYDYAPGSLERLRIAAELERLAASPIELTMTIAGEQRMAGGEPIDVVMPHRHAHVLGTTANATVDDARAAADAALAAAPAWQAMSFDDRAMIFLKAADLLAGPWRDRLNAATMLCQSKTVFQAEIDAACELIDFLRFNVHFARDVLAQQPISGPGVWNRLDHRPLEGFVYAVTPFNFTAIAGNLCTAPAIMGNTVVWKPSPTQQFAAHQVMALLTEAGLPPGVINMVTGDGRQVSDVLLADENLAGVHFTGSTAVFQHLYQTVASNIASYRSYPRMVGETGGKDFVLAHATADVAVLRTALIRGAFEYQGQKCSAASRAYIARSVWERVRDDLVAETEALALGDVSDFANFLGAVIDDRSFARLTAVQNRAHDDSALTVLAGGTSDDSEGYFVRPTLLISSDPSHDVFRTEFFGPILSIYVYDDSDYQQVLGEIDRSSKYALTGAVIAQDRMAVVEAQNALRYAAGNFYVNDKPTGAVVGQQPFGGSRASGTNDKAGAANNLLRWTSPRSIKDTFVPATSHSYPHQSR
ncbi:L-glutamate gamma-semialdehyde dehydrogenase [uncultured Jatrophihabitans sp.]|uniref:L-glutamate gamma-semialdehyde dehydrogenase n=1 Tax=uncultured Jatrophihabitans sp. TaxID=1610747 RepID=UPI0035CA9CA3